MKALLIALTLSLTASASHAQVVSPSYAALPKDSASQKVAYVGIIKVPGASATELFGRAGEWLARQNGLEVGGVVADPASGRQIAHLAFKQPPLSFTDTHSNLYRFAIAVYTKDGRYMYRIENFEYQNINPASMAKDAARPVPLEYYATQKENKRSAATLVDFNKRVTALVGGLSAAMSSGANAKGW